MPSPIDQVHTAIAAAPTCVQVAWHDFEDDPLATRDTARAKAAWCDEMAHRFTPAWHRHVFRELAALLRVAIPTLPVIAVPDNRQPVEVDYNRAVGVADKRFARRRRRVG